MMSLMLTLLAAGAWAQDADNPWTEVTGPEAGPDEAESDARPTEQEVDEPEPEPEPEPETQTQTEPEPVVSAPSPSLMAPAPLRFEVSFEIGSLANTDRAYRVFDDTPLMPSLGLRVGGRLIERGALIGGWHRVRRGAQVFLPGDQEFAAAYFADQFTLGPKIDVVVAEVLYPYVLAQALVMRGVMRFDDDPSVDDNAGQTRVGAAHGGALGVVGLEVRWPPTVAPVAVSLHLELGYAGLSRSTYGDVGSMRPGGFVLRSGAGLRF